MKWPVLATFAASAQTRLLLNCFALISSCPSKLPFTWDKPIRERFQLKRLLRGQAAAQHPFSEQLGWLTVMPSSSLNSWEANALHDNRHCLPFAVAAHCK